MTVQESGDHVIKTRYPAVEGLVAGTTKQEGTNLSLEAENSVIREFDKEGIY